MSCTATPAIADRCEGFPTVFLFFLIFFISLPLPAPPPGPPRPPLSPLPLSLKHRFFLQNLNSKARCWVREEKRRKRKEKKRKEKKKKRKEKKRKRKEKKRKEKKRKEKKRKEKKKEKKKKRKEKRREEKKRKERTRRQKQVPFHNRTHRTFLLFACVETPHSNCWRVWHRSIFITGSILSLCVIITADNSNQLSGNDGGGVKIVSCKWCLIVPSGPVLARGIRSRRRQVVRSRLELARSTLWLVQ